MLPAVVPQSDPHPYADLDRALRGAYAVATGGVSPLAMMQTWTDWALHMARAPGRQLELAEHAGKNAAKLMGFAARTVSGTAPEPPFAPKAYDHRFTDPGWKKPPFCLWQQSFLATQDWWDHATEGLRGLHPQDSDRARFLVRQMLDMASPSNFPATNPEIIDETVRTSGRNLLEGLSHVAEDVLRTVTQTRAPPPDGYKIGTDLACTPGKVVYRNDICELLQYSPQTDRVQAEPVLIVPAWIMKYYILDLSPKNSLINYLVGQGFTVFAISWCNPSAAQRDLSLEDYRLRGVMAAIDAINAIVPGQKIHANGYCLGGTILAIAAATMARDSDDRLASVTLMAAQLDFSEAGELLLFLDESQVAFLEDMMWAQGYLDRPQMARAFASIRAEDLIWTRAVRRYFLGQDDLPSDIGVWNADTTRMPALMHSEYLRGLFLENRLSAGRFAVEGRVIVLKDIDVPLFVIATESDHIAPWKSVYKTRLFTDADLTFVLTKGGHNGGILSEPGHPGRHYRIGHRAPDDLYVDPDTWFSRTSRTEGSWWPQWIDWLAMHSSDKTDPPRMAAPDKGFPVLGAAPGSYVLER
ncbi:alpha/beta fold hydrolase [Salipiger sp. 1_MG-2023]|uniref:PHA/PHB synthase family protein n=1 Tax=Salipiger sp. 1_MG-2023 TaxID=3062665 RepID=UPI0026E27B12|nr:alpha/beta fold hydrolase [Salipiger sp. 1_MG-2023]MDO6586550.1 alpha/beta fold hydrolase [Salipiger sp. 1_MG-2023]